jgi:hypothetical protein
MPDPTLENLAARVAALERAVGVRPGVVPPTRDWRTVVGISMETEFSRRMLAEMAAARETERQATERQSGR